MAVDKNKLKVQIKSIVKECLVEIFAENFIEEVVQMRINEMIGRRLNEGVQQQQQPQQQQQTDISRHLAAMAPDAYRSRTLTPATFGISQQTKPLISEPNDFAQRQAKYQETLRRIKFGDSKDKNSVMQSIASQQVQIPTQMPANSSGMQSIFEDTARTTLPAQASAVTPGGGGNPLDPGIDISGFANQNWAMMAGLK